MFNWVTADGYFAGPSGDLDWVVPDEKQAKMSAKVKGTLSGIFNWIASSIFFSLSL